MRYSEEIIEEVRSRSNIVDVVSQYVRLQKKGSSYFGLCPFHNEKSPSFSVSPSKQMFYCFGCGVGGNVFTFLMEYENATFPEALQELADKAGVTLPVQEYSREEKEKEDLRSALLAVNKAAASFYYYQLRSPRGERAVRYLTDRGISPETMKKFGLGFAGTYSNDLYRYLREKHFSDDLLRQSGLFNIDERRGMSDKFWNRVIYPIMDVNNRVIGFGGRVMGDAKPKYLNSPETPIFDKSRNLYGLNVARSTRRKNLILCEGYMDVITMHQAGFTNAVASLGTSLTAGHCTLLKRFTNEVLVIYDSDGAGVKAALRAIPMLKAAGLNARVIDLSPYKDPDEFIKAEGPEKFEERLEQGMNAFLYEISKLELDYDLSDPQGRTDFLHECARRLCTFTDEIERTSYLETISRRYRVEADGMKRLVSRLALSNSGLRNPETGEFQERKKETKMVHTGTDKAQRLILSWLAGFPEIYSDVRRYITLDDFTDPLYHKIAEILFQQYEKGNPNPAGILNYFTDLEEQKSAASVMHEQIRLDNDRDRQKALWDVICKIKEESLKYRQRNADPSDAAGFMQLLQEKKNLEAMKSGKQKIHFSFSEN